MFDGGSSSSNGGGGGGGGSGCCSIGGNSTTGIGTMAHQLATSGTDHMVATSAAAAQRMGMSFGIHSLLGLAAARDMQQGTAATYLTTTPQYCTNQTASFFPHNAPQLFTVEIPQSRFDRVQYEPINQGNSILFFIILIYSNHFSYSLLNIFDFL
ncbi:unnamed protein product [Cercopithifilaria johnstoni]|uniref:Uncharacterized protein n=1 Tax=Cercopithifilaria johnstoni TaxID=2874296 RepID=A0A8J2M164_9BILA|nr:unnamed protein product [Cercopithifilaria johnstoni]